MESYRRRPMNTAQKLLLGACIGIAGTAVACLGPPARGNFSRTLELNGSARLYLTNGSGSVRISQGSPGQARVQGELTVWPFLSGNPRQRVAELSQNPPIRQEGRLIRIGLQPYASRGIRIDYVIELPPDSEVHSVIGSGDFHADGLAGPVQASTGSGNIALTQIQGDVQTTAGSGNIRMNGVNGSVQANAGSGNVTLEVVGGSVRAATGSGNITLASPANTASLQTGSGTIHVSGASSDLRARTGSGTIEISGSPSVGAYWEFRTGTGNVQLDVPANTAFRFYAQTSAGNIHSSVPLTVLDQSSHALRAVVGQGSARVEVQAGTGNVILQSSAK
jgi:Toastrack DUF4097